MAKIKGPLSVSDLPDEVAAVPEDGGDTATAVAPLSIDPNQVGGYDSQMKNLLAQVMVTPEQQKKDELLAWSGGLTDSSGDIGNSMINANAAQSKYRLEDRKLRAQYTVPIMNALAQGQAANQSAINWDTVNFKGMPEEQVAKLSVLAKRDLKPLWESKNFGNKVEAGTYSVGLDDKGNQVKTWNLDPKTGLIPTPGGGVATAPGAAQAQSEIAGAVTGAQEKAKAGWNLVTVMSADNTPYQMYASAAFPGQFAIDPSGAGAAALPAGAKVVGAGGAGGATGAAPGGAGTGAQGTAENAQLPLGIRNNNPGNLRVPGSKTEFQKFPSMQEGLQALDNQLAIYGKRDKIDTIEGVISKWAPPNENNTKAYIERAQALLGAKPGEKIDLSNPLVRQAMSAAITLHENGSISRIGGGAAPAPTVAAPAAAGVPAGAVQTGSNPVTAQKQALQAKGDDLFMSKILPETMTVGKSATTVRQQIAQQRDAIVNGAFTGKWADIANTAAGYGAALGWKDADKAAASAGQFNKAAQAQVFANLATQNGVQTEGDASRMREALADLRDRPELTKFLLTSQDAIARRDEMKAEFYQKMRAGVMDGSAKDASGKPYTMSDIEGKWLQIMPPLYKMPEMGEYASRLAPKEKK